MNVSQWLRHASVELAEYDSARIDADLLMCFVLECERTTLYAWPEKDLDADQLSQLNALLEKRKQGHPVAYLVKQREFWSLNFRVSEHVLVPRPETELIVSLALLEMPTHCSYPVLDAGTGSGVIATAITHQWQSASDSHQADQLFMIASDYSMAALQVAKRNADEHAPGCIHFVHSNWLSAFADNTFGMIISNPPYLASSDSHLNNKTLQREPRSALVSGDDGLDDIRTLVTDACRAGKPGCFVLICRPGPGELRLLSIILAIYSVIRLQRHCK